MPARCGLPLLLLLGAAPGAGADRRAATTLAENSTGPALAWVAFMASWISTVSAKGTVTLISRVSHSCGGPLPPLLSALLSLSFMLLLLLLLLLLLRWWPRIRFWMLLSR
jgi:hypothetical protein